MLSASNIERDALRAGVNAFLRKPQDIGRLAATVTRLPTKKPSLSDPFLIASNPGFANFGTLIGPQRRNGQPRGCP
jgi:hypothetical protein